jgi:Flp pilus assembly protein TadD
MIAGDVYPRVAIFLFVALIAGCHKSADPTLADSAPGPNPALARQENDRAYQLIRQGKFEEAEPHLRRAIQADLTFGPAHNNLGLVYFHQKRFYDAAWEFDYAIKLMPYQPDARNNLGLVFEETGKFADAIDAYDRALKMAPDNPEYLGNLARTRIKRGDRDEDTRKLLEELTYKDSRPDWRGWARMKLFELYTRRPDPNPAATQPTP